MDFNLRDHTILLTLAGSRSYNTHTPSSDVDLKGIAVPPKSYYFGFLNRFEQADHPSHFEQFLDLLTEEELIAAKNTKCEGAVYELTKFIRLACDCNPSILDALYCRSSDIRLITPLGQKLRDNRDLFLSKKAKHTYAGYAFDQIKRIERHRRYLLSPPTHEPTRQEFGLLAVPIIPHNQMDALLAAIRKTIDGWELDLTDVQEATKIYVNEQIERYLLDMNLFGPENAFIAAARKVGCDDNLVEVLVKERKYKVAHDEYRKYLNWQKNRNQERAELEAKYGYDLKHATHCVRLIRQGKEILTTGKVNVFREDAAELLEVKGGKFTYEEITEYLYKEEKELDELYKTCTILPHSPDRVKLDQLCQEILEEFFADHK